MAPMTVCDCCLLCYLPGMPLLHRYLVGPPCLPCGTHVCRAMQRPPCFHAAAHAA